MAEPETTIPKLIEDRVSKYSGKLLLQRRDGWSWKQITWLDFDRDIKSIACFLLDLGFAYGDGVVIVSGNRIESLLSEIAVYHLGGVVIPIAVNEAPERIPAIAKDFNLRFVFVEDAEALNKILGISEKITTLNKLIVFSGPDEPDGSRGGMVMPFKGLVRFGMLKRKQREDDLRRVAGNVLPDDLACAFYSSTPNIAGGKIEFTHRELIESLRLAAEKLSNLHEEEQTYSYLPSVGLYEKLVSYLAIYVGCRTAFAENRGDFFEDVIEVKPTVIYETRNGLEEIFSGHIAKNRVADPRIFRSELGGRTSQIVTDSFPRDEVKELIRAAGINLIELSEI